MHLKTRKTRGFYIVAREPGAEKHDIPTWANRLVNPVGLDSGSTDSNSMKPTFRHLKAERVGVAGVPGAYQLLNVLSGEECQRFIGITETLGYLEDAAVSLPRSVRHNHSTTWVVDEQTDYLIWSRIAHLVSQDGRWFGNKSPVGLNARFRFYRYSMGDFFKPHTDGSWPGSRVINGELIASAYPDRWSQMTVLFFLSDNFMGGETEFFLESDGEITDSENSKSTTRVVSVRTPLGAALCFPHGQHPLHCVHGSAPIQSGTKYIIRTDMLFEL